MAHKSPWKLTRLTKESWAALYEDCAAARESILLEQYILNDDTEGRRFLKLFLAKAGEGVEVRLMLDKIGSRSVYYSKWPERIRKAGGHVRFFNPVTWHHLFTPRRWFPRDHAKAALIDGKIAHVGSACIHSAMKGWRDMHIRITGEVAEQFARAFAHLWKDPCSAEYSAPAAAPLRYLAGKSLRNRFYGELLKQIERARSEICIAGPYFMPTRKFIRLLKAAARRGVKVRLIVTGPTDVLLADCVAHSYFHTLLKAGVDIFVYEPTVLHVKYMLVDDDWATTGSLNFDYLSFFHNRESNLAISDAALIARLQAEAAADIAASSIYTVEKWKQRPLHYKVIGFLGRPLKRLL